MTGRDVVFLMLGLAIGEAITLVVMLWDIRKGQDKRHG